MTYLTGLSNIEQSLERIAKAFERIAESQERIAAAKGVVPVAKKQLLLDSEALATILRDATIDVEHD